MLLQFLPACLSLFFSYILLSLFLTILPLSHVPFHIISSQKFLSFFYFLFAFFMPYWFNFFTILSSSCLGNTAFPFWQLFSYNSFLIHRRLRPHLQRLTPFFSLSFLPNAEFTFTNGNFFTSARKEKPGSGMLSFKRVYTA